MRAPVLVAAVALALPFLAAPALVASADEGSPPAPTSASPRIRPPIGVLRHVDAAQTAVPSVAPAPARELVVLVGGYQSCACPDDGTFDALRDRLAREGNFDVIRFGTDPRFPYDTYGPIAPNARNLRDQIRSVSSGYGGVHVVTHSMGGVVADEAFTEGLSRDDGIISYVSWSAPHSGSDAARAIRLTQALTGGARGLRESLLWLQMEADSPAVVDLARARAPAPPAGVVRLDLREASDLLVTARDAADPGVPSRILTGAVEGHGGILKDPQAIDQTIRTIADRRVPPDDRSLVLRLAAEHESRRIGDAVFVALSALTCVALLTAILLRGPAAASLGNALRAYLPRADRRSCP